MSKLYEIGPYTVTRVDCERVAFQLASRGSQFEQAIVALRNASPEHRAIILLNAARYVR
jgi:hypothetical protein